MTDVLIASVTAAIVSNAMWTVYALRVLRRHHHGGFTTGTPVHFDRRYQAKP